MITIGNLAVPLGGRAILEDASTAIPLNGRIGLIGRNVPGKSTLMRVLIGELDPDQGSVEMPRRARVGYIAQKTPSGSITPFEAVLAGDIGREHLLEQAETCSDMNLLGDLHDRLLAIDDNAAPSTGELVRQRATAAAELENAEGQWLEAQERLERVGA